MKTPFIFFILFLLIPFSFFSQEEECAAQSIEYQGIYGVLHAPHTENEDRLLEYELGS